MVGLGCLWHHEGVTVVQESIAKHPFDTTALLCHDRSHVCCQRFAASRSADMYLARSCEGVYTIVSSGNRAGPADTRLTLLADQLAKRVAWLVDQV